MTSCLIGHTGFVGGNLLRQHAFDDVFRSTDIDAIRGRSYELVVCAGISAVKWKANKDPEGDAAAILPLRRALEAVRTERFVLISTVDVYPESAGVDERTDCHASTNHAYGANRLAFEDFARDRFDDVCVLRLSGLFGPGLKKNVLFDLLHDNRCSVIDPDSRFQWYDVRRLWTDVQRISDAGLRLVNLVNEPVRTGAVVDGLFDDRGVGAERGPTVAYDVRTVHADALGGADGYLEDADAVVDAIRSWVRDETGGARG